MHSEFTMSSSQGEGVGLLSFMDPLPMTLPELGHL